ncbi:catalase/peroxidase HPI [Nesterenkonia sp. MY13]|uniref:Catalase-peroxidase n=1 Tax=Nesterenkonia sedimenti TaxID=1463632 RepID=A0A7X8TKX2_9MICC|nr:catalase/peroxidase HPI [Nesterenkonia sedimenti]NLS09898.1 catalase/peroxidase HPI [Nesterenkonia sedimenti]
MAQNPDAYIDKTYDQALNARRDTTETPVGVRLDLTILQQPLGGTSPFEQDFDYPAAFETIDLEELAADIDDILTTSQDWWPADYGHYGPLILRMAWHCAGTYRIGDGRGGANGGMQRFPPLNSWPDNRNLDKARRLLWPVKQKYGRRLSWADLMVFAGNRALESMGFATFGFAGGRIDAWGPDETYWGPEKTMLTDQRHSGVRELDEPLAASEMGLIYVDPQGPGTQPDPIAAAKEIRQTFARMGMNDEETVALIAGGHTFGKTHGKADPVESLGPEPEAAPMEAQGLGWQCTHGCGKGHDAVGTGLEGIWTKTPTQWDNSFLETLFGYEWDVELSPAGQWQWVPSNGEGTGTVPDPFDPETTHHPTMLTTDLALAEDPDYREIAHRFLHHPAEFADSFARAWFKLTHIDMGPRHQYRGRLAPAKPLDWQEPDYNPEGQALPEDAISEISQRLLDCGLTRAQLVRTAWAAAATYRHSDRRGGTNGARLRLSPQCDWEVNNPEELKAVLAVLEDLLQTLRGTVDGAQNLSMADLIVIGGYAAIEAAAAEAGHQIPVRFQPGRTDLTEDDPHNTDPLWAAVLEPSADGFRNYPERQEQATEALPVEYQLIDQAQQLCLDAAELTALIGGMRVLGATYRDLPHGVLTHAPGRLTNAFFSNLLDPDVYWEPAPENSPADYHGICGRTAEVIWTASRVDLLFTSHRGLRTLAEDYAYDDAEERFVQDFAAAWHKVMTLGL